MHCLRMNTMFNMRLYVVLILASIDNCWSSDNGGKHLNQASPFRKNDANANSHVLLIFTAIKYTI